MKLSDYVFKFIAGTGVKHVFVLSGGGCMHLVDSLGKCRGLEYVCCLHEQAASIAATAYAQYNNNIGVALVTTGPGGTNAITGTAGAWVESVPMIIISGQVKRADMIGKSGVRTKGFQELDIAAMVKPVTKYAVTVTDPNEIRYHLEKAFYLAKSGRPGPVWIDIPLDVQAASINEKRLKGFDPKEMSQGSGRGKALENKVKRVVGLLNKARRPVILAGCGIKISNAQRSFIKLAGKLNVPVLTTWKAIDLLPEDHGLFFGRPGAIGQRGANFIQQNSDLIITIGARLDFGQIGYSHDNFARAAKKVIVDVDESEIRKLKFKVDVPVPFDAGLFIDEMLRQAGKTVFPARADWLSRCDEWKAKYPVVLPEYRKNKKYVSTYVLVDVLSKLMSGNDLFVPGSSGACSDIPMQAFRVKKGQRILNSPGIGAMGFGVPSTIGACLASGKKRTICTNGDGGFQLNIHELETISRLNLPIKFFVLNNKGYASIRNTQRNYFNGFYVASGPSSGVTLPDTLKIAKAYGIRCIKIKDHGELQKKVTKALSGRGPVICEVMVDPSEQIIPRLTSQILANGAIVSKPMEDLYPFLDREEFRSNMLIGDARATD